jgi:hypothetical protein
MLTVTDIYSVRFGAKLPLPLMVQDKIARLRITPVAYKPTKPFVKHAYRPKPTPAASSDNWREKAFVEAVRRVKEREDPEYSDIFSIFNKVSLSNVEKLSNDAVVLMKKRDDQFRLRVSTLLFDKAITQASYSAVMADCASKISGVIPEVADDVRFQINMFPKLYDMNDTITFPDSKDEKFDEKVVLWMKQKEKRRGFAKFMMELLSRNLISEEDVYPALQQVIRELNDVARQPATETTTESTTQFVQFLFEASKMVSGGLNEYLKKSLQEILAVAKMDLPSLNMRSKFKLEDAFNELNKKGTA